MGSQTHEELQILNLSSFSLENLESKFQSLAHVLHNALWHTVTWGQLFHQEAINYFHSCHKDGNWTWGIETESLKYFPWKYCSYSLLPNLHTVRQKCNCRTVNVTEVRIAATLQEQSQQYWATTYCSGNPSLHTGMKDTVTNVPSWKGLRMTSSCEQSPRSQANPLRRQSGKSARHDQPWLPAVTLLGATSPGGDTTMAWWRLLPQTGLGGGWSCLSKAARDRNPSLRSITSRGRAVPNNRDGHF